MITEEEIKSFIESRGYYVNCHDLYLEGLEEGIRWALGRIDKAKESE